MPILYAFFSAIRQTFILVLLRRQTYADFLQVDWQPILTLRLLRKSWWLLSMPNLCAITSNCYCYIYYYFCADDDYCCTSACANMPLSMPNLCAIVLVKQLAMYAFSDACKSFCIIMILLRTRKKPAYVCLRKKTRMNYECKLSCTKTLGNN